LERLGVDTGDFVFHDALDPKIRLRPVEADAVPVTEVVLPLSVQSESAPSQVDVNRLASAARGEEAEPRPSQVAMVETMRQFLSTGQDALIEAPTGTGKSYAVMAVALEWLAADPRHRVVISTYTKQLQRQLAQDIERLSKAGLPGIAEATDMVKGAGNRLSLRVLVAALAACTSDAAAPRRRRGGGFAREPRFADLLLYLTLRLRAQGGLLEEWEAHSVDGFDVPGFFIDYCGSRLPTYLWSLSQGSSGEMGASHSGGLGRHTRTVREALERSRFVIANHALLLANLEAFDDIGEHTLLVVDEAHVLEGTATASLTANVDYQSLEDAIAAVRRWHTDQGEGAVPVDLTQALDEVENFLRLEQLPRSARAALDTLPRDPLHRDFPRQMTLIAPTSSENPSPAINALFSSIEEMRHHLDQLQRAFRLVPTPGEPFELERLQLLRFGIAELGAALSLIARSIASNLAPPGADAPAEPPASGHGHRAVATAETEDEGQDESEEPILPEEERETPTAALARHEPAARPNQVVWLQELSDTQQTIELRQYTFRINSSPVDLAEEPRYRRFLRSFGRAFFVSATLRVAEKWDFIRRRLGLDSSTVAARHLESPFNAATQARLICFDDFPSWMEQEEAATRTVAHQVAGYLSAVGQDGANGAMVLTTARATAAAISDHLVEMRRRSGGTYHISSTIMLGNERAVDTFRDLGGALVGTKGLWQGVDINDPQRLRLVWINKLPFLSFADPVIAARLATIHREAEADGAASPQDVANETYYLPLAAIELRQAVGRLIRTLDHRGVVVISDRKLAGTTRLRRLYRSIFLGSLDSGLLLPDPETGEMGGGNVTGMAEGWRRIWEFLAANGIVSGRQFADLTQAQAIDRLIHLPQLRLIREAMMTPEAEADAREEGRLEAELLERA
jgi:Rad3-related DNA helicase